jgi:hypothetical protein
MCLYVVVGGSFKFLKYQLTINFFLLYSNLELALTCHHYDDVALFCVTFVIIIIFWSFATQDHKKLIKWNRMLLQIN